MSESQRGLIGLFDLNYIDYPCMIYLVWFSYPVSFRILDIEFNLCKQLEQLVHTCL